MKKWFATISCGAGMKTSSLYEVDTQEEAESWAREECIDWATSFGYYQDEEYANISELEYYVKEYVPEEHDGYLY